MRDICRRGRAVHAGQGLDDFVQHPACLEAAGVEQGVGVDRHLAIVKLVDHLGHSLGNLGTGDGPVRADRVIEGDLMSASHLKP